MPHSVPQECRHKCRANVRCLSRVSHKNGEPSQTVPGGGSLCFRLRVTTPPPPASPPMIHPPPGRSPGCPPPPRTTKSALHLQHPRLPRNHILQCTPCGKTTHHTRSLGQATHKPTNRHQSTKTNSNDNNHSRIQPKTQQTTNKSMNQNKRRSNKPSNVLQ